MSKTENSYLSFRKLYSNTKTCLELSFSNDELTLRPKK